MATTLTNSQDLYLIEPPPGAPHKAIPPSKIVFAGDSAGAGLSLTLLTVLRDMGLPMPAGAVLISPWIDMTHSFPSIMSNTPTVKCTSQLWPLKTYPDHERTSYLRMDFLLNHPHFGQSSYFHRPPDVSDRRLLINHLNPAMPTRYCLVQAESRKMGRTLTQRREAYKISRECLTMMDPDPTRLRLNETRHRIPTAQMLIQPIWMTGNPVHLKS